MLDNNAMFKLSYGLFVLSACENNFNNGCIINTVMQITDSPKQIAIAVNKDNKNVLRNAVIGFAAGLFLSMILVFVANRFDVVVRNRDKIEENFELPILGVIPRLEIENNKTKEKGEA